MKINISENPEKTKVYDLSSGDVFARIVDNTVCMAIDEPGDYLAPVGDFPNMTFVVRLKDGLVFPIDNDEEIKILDCTLNAKLP